MLGSFFLHKNRVLKYAQDSNLLASILNECIISMENFCFFGRVQRPKYFRRGNSFVFDILSRLKWWAFKMLYVKIAASPISDIYKIIAGLCFLRTNC